MVPVVRGGFAAAIDNDGVVVRSWMWMTGEPACERIESVSIRTTARIGRTFSCSALEILEGVFRKILIPSEGETARSAGTMAEKMKEVPLMRLGIEATMICQAVQNPPDEFRPLATEHKTKPISMAISVVCEIRLEPSVMLTT